MKKIIFSSIVLVSLFWAKTALSDDVPTPLDFGPTEALTIISGDTKHQFNVEIADTSEERARGYMFRDVVGPTDGMLFEFERVEMAGIYMKNTSVFLDILFVRPNGRILKIEHSAKPYSLRTMTSEAPVAAVLEIAGGQAHSLGIKPGDRIEHEFFTAN